MTKSPSDASPCPSGMAAKASPTPRTSQTRPWSLTGQHALRSWLRQPLRSGVSSMKTPVRVAAHAKPLPRTVATAPSAAHATASRALLGTGSADSAPRRRKPCRATSPSPPAKTFPLRVSNARYHTWNTDAGTVSSTRPHPPRFRPPCTPSRVHTR